MHRETSAPQRRLSRTMDDQHRIGSGRATISIIIPALNEAANLPFVLPRIPPVPEILEVILVDGASTDGTADIARDLLAGIRIVEQDGCGKGNAVKCGAQAAKGDYFLVLDADGSQMPEEIPIYLEQAREGYDLVKGSRYLDGRDTEDETLGRVLMCKLTYFVANSLWQTKFSDIGYGVFLINREKFLDLDIKSNFFEMEYELMIKAKRKGLKIVEVPAHENARIHGKSHLSYRHDGWLIFKTVLREWWRGLRERPGESKETVDSVA